MCFGFLNFYPNHVIRSGDADCISKDEVPVCAWNEQEETKGCNIHNFVVGIMYGYSSVYEQVSKCFNFILKLFYRLNLKPSQTD